VSDHSSVEAIDNQSEVRTKFQRDRLQECFHWHWSLHEVWFKI